MNHLEEAKITAESIDRDGTVNSPFIPSATLNALIAIAEQLERIHITMIDEGIAKGFWDEIYVEEDK